MWALSRVSSDSFTTHEPMAVPCVLRRSSWIVQHVGAQVTDTTSRKRRSARGAGRRQHRGEAHRPPLLGKAPGRGCAPAWSRPHCRRTAERTPFCPPTCPPCRYMAAAMPTAPAPSATSFCFSNTVRMALAISPSLTVTTSSTYCSAHIERQITGSLDLDTVGHCVHAAEGDESFPPSGTPPCWVRRRPARR